ncbi:MAG TPA: serine/threonine-protein kinase [Polyangiales bacterium]|nr:serine/threonine-protein kinase [Polyangiales bacterium]
MPEVGELLVAKYRVLALLGAGGMGSVYRAENVLTGKHVALKWMHPQYASSPDAAERLIREARAASRLSHPNVVDVYDVIRDDQTLFLVMELLQGESLRDFLRNRGRPRELPMHELVAILLGAMSGVAAAHAQGVIHRDLKPDNIFLERIPGVPQPVAKVLDFGIAKLAEVGDVRGATLTQTGTAIGTPVYMSFEQLRGDKNIDFRTDVYAFGVMLYEALVGHAPFTAATLSELAIKVATTEAVPLKNLRPDVPTSLCAIVERAIRRDRDERWPDVPSLMAALAPFAQPSTFRESMSFQDMTAPRVAPPQRRAQRSASPLEPDWAGTAAYPNTQPASLPVATPRATHMQSDSLVARERDDTDSPKSHTLPVWVAAAALLAVTVIAAVLLLGSPVETKPNSAARPVETTTSAVVAPPPLAAPSATPPPGLQIEAVTPEPSPVPNVEPVPPVVTQPELPSADNNSDEPSVTRKRRSTRAARELPRAERAEPQQEPRRVRAARQEPEREREPAREPTKPKNATDLLGF